MFSGIIEQLGQVEALQPEGKGVRMRISSPLPVSATAGVGSADREQIGLGDSIAVNGACLTVDALEPPRAFSVVCGFETLQMTKLGRLRVGDKVHMERSLRVGDRLDGHLVQGHVDGIGRVRSAAREQESLVLWVEAPSALQSFIAVKGSIAMDGVSLTVNELLDGAFRVNIVPYTLDETLLLGLRVGEPVNLEVDVIARYVQRMLNVSEGALSFDRLKELGFASSWAQGGNR
jgi:riboflavin synthase